MAAREQTARGYRSGELARVAGVSPDTLRHYERSGLLEPPRRLANGYRVYPPEALDRVLLIQRGVAIGFTLSELGVFLRERSAGHPPCKQVQALASRHLEAVERQIDGLQRLRRRLRTILRDWDARMAKRPEGSPARLLESLTSEGVAPGAAPLHALRFVHRRKKGVSR
jgi:DNA-binding transcriptional MerR regulator